MTPVITVIGEIPLKRAPARQAARGDDQDAYGNFLANLHSCRSPEYRERFAVNMDAWLCGLDSGKQVAAVLEVAARQTTRLIIRVTAELDIELEKQDREHNRPPLSKGSAFPAATTALIEQRNKLIDVLLSLQERQVRAEHLRQVNRKAASGGDKPGKRARSEVPASLADAASTDADDAPVPSS